MNEGLIPRRYAKALLKLATEKGCADRLYTLMRNLVAAFAGEQQLQKAVSNPYLPFERKVSLLTTAAEATEADTLYKDFLQLLEQNRRMAMLRECAIAYVDIYRKDNHIYRVEVTAASQLDPEQEKRLSSLIEKHLCGGKMEYTFSVDPSLVGGFTVTVDNERLDASVANELRQMRRQLTGK